MSDTMDKLRVKIKYIEKKIIETNDKQKKYDLSVQYHELKLSLLKKLNESDRKRPGINARAFIKDVEGRPEVPRMKTGIFHLDDMFLGGIETGSLINFAGASHLGKSYIMFEILSNISKENKTVFFNFEMGDKKVVKKLNKFFKTDEQLDNLILDNDSRMLEDLIMEITLYADDGVKFFAIDSRMKIEVTQKMEDHKKASIISNQLAKLAQKKDIIILLINQISEEDLKSGRLSFKASGDTMYDTDIAMFIVKDEDGAKHLKITKNRQDEILFGLEIDLDEDGNTYSKNSYYLS